MDRLLLFNFFTEVFHVINKVFNIRKQVINTIFGFWGVFLLKKFPTKGLFQRFQPVFPQFCTLSMLKSLKNTLTRFYPGPSVQNLGTYFFKKRNNSE